MKKAVVILAALAFTTVGTGFAQTKMAPVGAPKTPAERAGHQVQALTRQLGLSAEQAPKVESILQAQLTEMQALNERYPAGNRRGIGPELKASKVRYDEQLKAVLTPEQFARLEQLRQERRQQLRDRRNG
jgi:protein CpxP